MIKINAKTYAKNCINTIAAQKKDNETVLWIKMYNIRYKLYVKNMCHLTIKATKGIYKTKISTNEQIKRCERYEKS